VFEGLGNAVHLIAAVVWIGGLALLVLGLRPALKKSVPEEASRDAIEAPLHRRFFALSAFSAAVLLLSGLMLMTSDAHFLGFGNYENTWSKLMVAKHVLFVGMIGLLVVQRKARAAKVERDLVDIALMLGVAVLVVTGLLTALP
jgi:putative copper export protein